MIYLDSSVALAYLFGEGRLPPASLWQEPLTSSRLLEYEVWNRINARRLGPVLHDDARIRRLVARGARDDAARERAWAEEVLNQARERWATACRADEEAAMDLDLANFEVSRLAERVRELLVRQAPSRSSTPPAELDGDTQ